LLNRAASLLTKLRSALGRSSRTLLPPPYNTHLGIGDYLADEPPRLLQYAAESEGTLSFVAKLEAGHYEFEDARCPVCDIFEQRGHSVALFEALKFRWSLCDCGTIYMSHRISSKSIVEFYKSGEYHSVCMGDLPISDAFLLERSEMADAILSALHVGGFRRFAGLRIADIGCGAGGLLSRFQDLGADVEGLDIDPALIQFGTDQGVRGLRVADVNEPYRFEATPDIIIVSNILEHLVNPSDFLMELRRSVSSGNPTVVIDVPNVEGIAQYHQNWQRFFHIGHLSYFSPESVSVLLRLSGFVVHQVINRGAAMSLICQKIGEDADKEIKLSSAATVDALIDGGFPADRF